MAENETRFKVIEGGLSTAPSSLTFQSAWVTDTRLMGVVVMCIHWQGADPLQQVHQYYYFDSEGLGFDRFDYMEGPMSREVGDLEASFVGGLGGTKKPLIQREAAHLLSSYVEWNRANKVPLPSPSKKYMWITEAEDSLPKLNIDEQKDLFSRMCVPTRSVNALANYYLMRACGKDFKAMEFLSYKGSAGDPIGAGHTASKTSGAGPTAGDPFHGFAPGVFYSNKVRPQETFDEHGGQRVLCESTIESGGFYYQVVSALTCIRGKVALAERLSMMKLSEMEAYLILNHSEFVTVFDFQGNPDAFRRGITALSKRAIISEEHDGRCFMIYHLNNEHVEQDEYFLHNDLLGLYHISDRGELIVAAPNIENIRRMELDIQFSKAHNMIEPLGSFEFNEPVVMQYLESDFPSFMEFMEAIQEDD